MEGTDYSQLTVAMLKEELDGRGIEYVSSDLKQDLIDKLKADDAHVG